jgi:hypothetical protein
MSIFLTLLTDLGQDVVALRCDTSYQSCRMEPGARCISARQRQIVADHAPVTELIMLS